MAGDETRDEVAVGHTVILALSNPKTWMLLAGFAGLGGFGWMQKGSSDTSRLLRKISKDVLQVKVTTSAMLQTMPEAQKQRAQKIIDLQMAALSMARESE